RSQPAALRRADRQSGLQEQRVDPRALRGARRVGDHAGHRHARGPRRRADAPAGPDDRRRPERGAMRRPRLRRPRISSVLRRVRERDLTREAVAGLIARTARVILTILGTVIGVGALVATLGLSKTAASQIVGHFDAVSATDIVVSPSARAGGTGAVALPWDAESRLKRLNGVAAAGTLSDVDVHGALVRSVPVNDPLAAGAIQLPMKAASPGLFRAVRAQLGAGRYFDAGHSHRGDRVLVLGPNAAKRLHITRVDDQPAAFSRAGVSLLVGAIGIANVTLVSVLERVGEIGLRRALGAARRHIAAQFLLESTAMGLAGGIAGSSVGTLVIVGVSASNTWTPVLDPWVPLGAPALGA